MTDACVLDGEGYPAGPGCAHAYSCEAVNDVLQPNRFWQLVTSGVQVHSSPWVNVWGFTMFGGARCPRCKHHHGDEFLEQLTPKIARFNDTGVVPRLSCERCGHV